MKRKLLPIIVLMVLAASIVTAAPKEIFNKDGNRVTCENCVLKEQAVFNIYSCGETECTFEFFELNDKKYGFLKLRNAEVEISSSGYPHIVRATKHTKVKNNINGYEVDMSEKDWILFKGSIIDDTQMDIFGYSISYKPAKSSDGKLKPVVQCGQEFKAVGQGSSFDIQLKHKKGVTTPECEMTYYKLLNVVDEKDKKANYDYKCGDISYHATGKGLNGVNCLPKLEYTSDAKRKNESKLYCDSKDQGCKGSFFWFDVDSERYTTTLKVVVRGLPSELTEKTDFQSLVSKPDPNSRYKSKILTAKSFAIGPVVYTPLPKGTESPTVTFVEQSPHMYVPNGMRVDMAGAFKNKVTIKYLPEFFKNPPPGVKFQGYNFRFDNKRQGPEVIYPFGIKKWQPSESEKIGQTYHIAMKPTIKMEGWKKLLTTKDGKKWIVPERLIIEMRVKPDYLVGDVATKPKTTTKTCVNGYETKTIDKNQPFSQYAINLLGYTKAWNSLSKAEKLNVQKKMTALILLNLKEGTTAYAKGGKGKCTDLACGGKVSLDTTGTKKREDVWDQTGKGWVKAGDKVKVPCNSLVTATKGKKGKVRIADKDKKVTTTAKNRKANLKTVNTKCAAIDGECMTFDMSDFSSQKFVCKRIRVAQLRGAYTVVKGLCSGSSKTRCCAPEANIKNLKWQQIDLDPDPNSILIQSCNPKTFKLIKNCEDGKIWAYKCIKNSIHKRVIKDCASGCEKGKSQCYSKAVYANIKKSLTSIGESTKKVSKTPLRQALEFLVSKIK